MIFWVITGPTLNVRTKRVVGGEGAKTGEFPFMALLGYQIPNKTENGGIEYQCGGALINKYVIDNIRTKNVSV